MIKKIELSEEIKNKISSLNNSGKTLREMSVEVGYSTTKISFYLKSVNEYKYKNNNDIVVKKILDENLNYIAICPITKIEFTDFVNRAGYLTTHLTKYRPEITIPTHFLRKEYFVKNGVYWHEQFFDFEERDVIKKEILKCKYCDFETYDIKNTSGHYGKHLKKHGISVEKHLEDYPEEKYLFNIHKLKLDREEEFKTEGLDYVVCKICGKKFRQIRDTHTKLHGLTIQEYKEMYGFNTVSSKLSIIYSKTAKKHNEILINTFKSKPQLEIGEHLKKNNIEILENNKSVLCGTEIDIIVEDKKIGIEYNGCYYHNNKPMNYHLNKTKMMNDKGYKLIHIFEDEYLLKKNIVYSKIDSIFGIKNKEKIYARKCDIKEIDSHEKNVFLEKNHLQGGDKSNIHLGCFYGDKLISVMTFDNKRSMNGGNSDVNFYDLKRFASDIDYHVVGVASKILKYFIKKYKPSKIISFADRRWTMDMYNNLYLKLGFKLVKILPPNYTYFKSSYHRVKRHHKFEFGKKMIQKRFPEFYNENKTENEMMSNIGFSRIWDCGLFKYELIVNDETLLSN